jgi:hypothetical protein
MISYLDQARHRSSDPFNGPTVTFSWRAPSGSRGRPRIEIDPDLLTTALALRPKTRIANTANCSARTIRRRQQEHGIVTPRQSRIHQPTNQEPTVNLEIADQDLDQYLAAIIQDFPSFGRRLATASLRASGIEVPESRVRESLLRVNGTPGTFGGRRVHRRRTHSGIMTDNTVCARSQHWARMEQN